MNAAVAYRKLKEVDEQKLSNRLYLLRLELARTQQKHQETLTRHDEIKKRMENWKTQMDTKTELLKEQAEEQKMTKEIYKSYKAHTENVKKCCQDGIFHAKRASALAVMNARSSHYSTIHQNMEQEQERKQMLTSYIKKRLEFSKNQRKYYEIEAREAARKDFALRVKDEAERSRLSEAKVHIMEKEELRLISQLEEHQKEQRAAYEALENTLKEHRQISHEYHQNYREAKKGLADTLGTRHTSTVDQPSSKYNVLTTNFPLNRLKGHGVKGRSRTARAQSKLQSKLQAMDPSDTPSASQYPSSTPVNMHPEALGIRALAQSQGVDLHQLIQAQAHQYALMYHTSARGARPHMAFPPSDRPHTQPVPQPDSPSTPLQSSVSENDVSMSQSEDAAHSSSSTTHNPAEDDNFNLYLNPDLDPNSHSSHFPAYSNVPQHHALYSPPSYAYPNSFDIYRSPPAFSAMSSSSTDVSSPYNNIYLAELAAAESASKAGLAPFPFVGSSNLYSHSQSHPIPQSITDALSGTRDSQTSYLPYLPPYPQPSPESPADPSSPVLVPQPFFPLTSDSSTSNLPQEHESQ